MIRHTYSTLAPHYSCLSVHTQNISLALTLCKLWLDISAVLVASCCVRKQLLSCAISLWVDHIQVVM